MNSAKVLSRVISSKLAFAGQWAKENIHGRLTATFSVAIHVQKVEALKE